MTLFVDTFLAMHDWTALSKQDTCCGMKPLLLVYVAQGFLEQVGPLHVEAKTSQSVTCFRLTWHNCEVCIASEVPVHASAENCQ